MSDKALKIITKVLLCICLIINLIFIVMGEWALLLTMPLAGLIMLPLFHGVTGEDFLALIWWNQK